MARRPRDRAAEGDRRRQVRAELVAQGVDPKLASRVAYGHAKPGEPTLKAVKAAAAATGLTLGRIVQRETRWAKSTRFGRAGGRVIVDTSSKRDAKRILRQVARDGKQVRIIGTRNGRGKAGAPVNRGNPIDAGAFLDYADDFDDLWDAIADADEAQYSGAAPAGSVVRVHIEVLR